MLYPKYAIVNNVDAPSVRLVAECINGAYYYMARQHYPELKKYDGMQPTNPTAMEAFGFTVEKDAGGIVTFAKTSVSKATYPDGLFRDWQDGRTVFTLPSVDPKALPSAPQWGWYAGEGKSPESYVIGPYASRADAYAEAEIREWDNGYTICEAVPSTLSDELFHEAQIQEAFHELNSECTDQDGDLDFSPTSAEYAELVQQLNTVFATWRQKYKLGRAFSFAEHRNEEYIPAPHTESGPTEAVA